ncbi:AFG2-interacting ribosome maturation factor [Narcine bancroftii]|uniref:AFG2-interacting ribosome maturation factor n=1 Tax=Narcine bancroftii TaxID=1343680 RepID=UPI00383184F1
MAQKTALTVVHQALEKCFLVIEKQQSVWDSTLMECAPLLSSMSNLAEQLQACNNVDFKNSPFQEFPDLKHRLKYKLTQAMEINLEKLGEKMDALQRAQSRMSNQVVTCFQMYALHADTIGLTAVLERSSLNPSVADMLEWLQDIERFYRSQYFSKKILLQNINYDNLPHIQALPQSWNRVSEQMDQDLVRDTLLKVSFFMESHQGSEQSYGY